MIEIKVISLKSEVHRKEKIKNVLSCCNFEFLDAINGKEMKASDYFELFSCHTSKRRGRKFLTPSELGCFLSHKKAIDDFILSDNNWLLVLEDDVDVVDNLSEFIPLIEGLRTDSIYILGGQDGLSSFKYVILGKSETAGVKRVMMKTYKKIYRTCCYLVHRNTALEIQALMHKYRFMADDWAFIIRNTNINNVFYKRLFSHPVDLCSSTIELERDSATKIRI
ncbi:TPA: glycosyltransferase family 25 protein [Vibrio cholerae]|nr:glycosyltransferase family 25 protein [Vibrio cholerae]EKE6108259.1 glycosyltransferase family 25 protein [Vibrio cholerae]BCN20068.1 putative glycosyltransferase [Vibrio cholerae]GHZ12222.1 glycosyl transferase [Vibrio cholerae]